MTENPINTSHLLCHEMKSVWRQRILRESYCSDLVLWSIHHIAAIVFTLCLNLHEPGAAKHGAAIFGERSAGEKRRDTATLNLILGTKQDCKIIGFLLFNMSEKRLFDIIDTLLTVSFKTQALGQSQPANPSNPHRQMDRVAKSCAQFR